jgi:hypothetical protein
LADESQLALDTQEIDDQSEMPEDKAIQVD